jgi:hypothetical protein
MSTPWSPPDHSNHHPTTVTTTACDRPDNASLRIFIRRVIVQDAHVTTRTREGSLEAMPSPQQSMPLALQIDAYAPRPFHNATERMLQVVQYHMEATGELTIAILDACFSLFAERWDEMRNAGGSSGSEYGKKIILVPTYHFTVCFLSKE